MKKQNLNQGITLIALVITIIVLLILAGVSISAVIGENGIASRANDAKQKTRIASIKEYRDMWITEKNIGINTNLESSNSLEELLDTLEDANLISEQEREKIKKDSYLEINFEKIWFSTGIENKYFVVESSNDNILFEKTVKEGDISYTKPNYTNYVIEGVSSEKYGEYITSGTLEGKAGELEIIGEIQDSTFKFSLNKGMYGDEIFYVKINIDEEILYQELHIVQGDVVTYEEDFIGYNYIGAERWIDTVDENYSGGKAKVCEASNDAEASVELYGLGSKYEIISRSDDVAGTVLYLAYGEGNKGNKGGAIDMLGLGDGVIEYQVAIVVESGNTLEKINIIPTTAAMNDNERVTFYFDAIKIYR